MPLFVFAAWGTRFLLLGACMPGPHAELCSASCWSLQEMIDQSEGRNKRSAEAATAAVRGPAPRPASGAGAGRPPLHPPLRPPSQQADSHSLAPGAHGLMRGQAPLHFYHMLQHGQQQMQLVPLQQELQPPLQQREQQVRWAQPAARQLAAQSPLSWGEMPAGRQLSAAGAAAAGRGGVQVHGRPKDSGNVQLPAWPQTEAPNPSGRAALAPGAAAVAGHENGSVDEVLLGGSHQPQRQQHQQAATSAPHAPAEALMAQGAQPSLSPESVQAMLLQLVLPTLARGKLP